MEQSAEMKDRPEWKIETNNLDELQIQIDAIAKYLIEEYTLEPETREEEMKSYITKARFKKKTLPGIEFDTWIEEEYEKFKKR